MLRTIIVEDERAAEERLQRLIENQADLELMICCKTGNEAIEQINKLKPDLVFLDIQLPDISGLDLLKVLERQPLIIFTTAYDHYAVNAFEHNALDFLLKPFSEERFQTAVQKALSRQQQVGGIRQQLQTILSDWRQPDQYLTRIPAKLGERIFILKSTEVLYFRSKDKLVFANLTKDSFIINYTLDELQNRLDPEQFFRIHRGTIANLNHVLTIEPLFGGAFLMKMNDREKTELKVSRNAAKLVREKIGW